MKKYTFDEIRKILSETQESDFCFSEADRHRALTNPYLMTVREDLLKEGDALRGTPIEEAPFSAFKRFEMDGNRREYESYYFKKRARLTTFALLSWLYGREDDIKELENIIWAILNEYTWTLPAHLTKPCFANDKSGKNRVGLSDLQEDGYIIALFCAETGLALAETLSLVGDKLTSILVKRTERYIKTRILDIVHNDFMWKHTHNNWKAVCGGSCAMTAIYQEKDIDNLSRVIAMVLPHIQDFCDSYTEDGACTEGLGYWLYGFGFFVYFADMLKKRTAGMIDLFDDEKVKKMALFFQKCFFPGKGSVVFADAVGNVSFSPDLTSYLARTYDEACIPPLDFIKLGYSNVTRFPLGVRSLIWTDERLGEKSQEICGVNILENAQWYMGSSKNGVGLAAKAGHNNEAHNHNDVGSFHIFKNGKMTLADIGSGEYVRDYFGPLRYTYFCNSSASHNLPIINGSYQLPGRDHTSKDVTINESGLKCDIAGAYGDATLKRLVRDINFCADCGIVTISDSYEFSKTPVSVVERFVSFDEPKLETGKILFGKDEISTLEYDAEMLSATISTETYNDHSGIPTKVYLVDLTVKFPSEFFDVKITIH